MRLGRPLTIVAVGVGLAAFGAGAVLAADSGAGNDPTWIGGPIFVGAASPTVSIYNPGTASVDAKVEYIPQTGVPVSGASAIPVGPGESVTTACGCPAGTYVFRVTASGFVIPSADVPVAGADNEQFFAGDFVYLGADGQSPTASTIDAIAALSASLDSRTQSVDSTTKAVDATTKDLQVQDQALQAQVAALKKQNKKFLKKLKKLSRR
jgi:hypothetical protein